MDWICLKRISKPFLYQGIGYQTAGKTMKEISMFTSSKLAPLESVVSTVTHFVLKKYKDHGTVLEAKKVDERQAVTP